MGQSTERSDEELIDAHRAAPEGDHRAFDRLVRRYQARVVTNCRYLSRSSEDAADLAQEVFVKVFFGLDRFEKRSSFRTWLHRIKANHCMNHLSKQAGKTFVDVDDPGVRNAEPMVVRAGDGRSAARIDDRRRIVRALDGMNDTLRVPLLLRDMDGLSYQEIADLLGVGLSAVKMRIKRAREEFRGRAAAAPPPAAGPAAATVEP